MQGYLFSRPVPAGEIKDILSGMAWCPAGLLQAESPPRLLVNEFVLEAVG